MLGISFRRVEDMFNFAESKRMGFSNATTVDSGKSKAPPGVHQIWSHEKSVGLKTPRSIGVVLDTRF